MHAVDHPEFALLVACCTWPLSVERTARLAREVMDWPRFQALAERHRVEGLVASALRRAGVAVPAPISVALETSARLIAHQNLRFAAETVQLDRLLRSAAVAPLFVKGITLGKLAYGEIARKSGWDIDLLIAPEELGVTADVLLARGYVPTVPADALVTGQLTAWHTHAKESVWRSADGTLWVELHTGLTDNPLLLAGVDSQSPRQEVEISPGVMVTTLATDYLAAYLCAHGASSAWFRLKWIADFAALMGHRSAIELDRFYQFAQQVGAGRSVAQAMLLGHRLFKFALSPTLLAELQADRVNRWLTAIALRKLTGRTGTRELEEVTLGTASIHLMQLGLLPGWTYKRRELIRQLISPVDRLRIALPRALAWVYPLMRLRRMLRSGDSGR